MDTLFDPYPLRVGNTKVYFWRNQRPLTMQWLSRSCRHREVQGVQVSGTFFYKGSPCNDSSKPSSKCLFIDDGNEIYHISIYIICLMKYHISYCLMKYMVFFSKPESCTLKYVQLYMVLPASLAELWQYRPTLITGTI